MHSRLFALTLVLPSVFFAAPAFAQATVPAPPAEPPAAQKLNGVYADLSLGVIGIGYERVVSDVVALNLTAHYYRPWYESEHLYGFGGEFRPYFFVTGRAPEGVFFAPGLRLESVRAKLDDGTTPTGGAFSVKATVGYGVILGDWFSLRVGAGIQSHASDVKNDVGDRDLGGAYPAVDLLVGAAF